MEQIQVWQLYTDTSLGAIIHHHTVVRTGLYKQTSLKFLLHRRLEGSWSSVKSESWAVSSQQKKHHEKVQDMCLFSNTFFILQEDIHCLVFSCPGGDLRSGSVIDWHPCRADTLETCSAEIWDGLPKQQETLPTIGADSLSENYWYRLIISKCMSCVI